MQKIRHSDSGSLSLLCSLLGYSRQAFYSHWRDLQTDVLNSELVIKEVLIHRSLQPHVGTRKLLLMLQDFMAGHGINMGRDAMFSMLRQHGLLVRKRRRTVVTTFSGHAYKKYPNLIRGFIPVRPGQLLVSDITYVIVGSGFAYLSLVTDAYSHKITGYNLSRSLDARGAIMALRMALENQGSTSGMIHHSDRGVQYCCNDYIDILQKSTIQISMTENGDPLENAIAERVNGILKTELLKVQYPNFIEAKQGITKAIDIYNSVRLHASCDMLTPVEAHTKQGELKKHWKNYYKKKGAAMNEYQ